MSQNHVLLTGAQGDVYIVMGYDRPLGELFCNVTAHDEDETDYSPLMFRQFSNAQEIGKALSEVGLTVPEPMLAVVEDDLLQQAGNVTRRFDAQGLRVA